ncbi:uncharacterized protein LOC141907774 [Tubulanus polymorphus]|uniref:uncharacterized protein LOC141907774 n=1 Tax=Tubulanus polymorphus TaxID=672921 RepID=UPI003DA3B12E
MYHQVKVREEDRPALSFLWRDLDTTRPPDVYEMQVTIFGARCSPAMANYVLRKTAEDNESEVDAETAAAIRKHFYMDDFLKSENSTAKAIQRAKDVTMLVKRGGFRLTKWTSNSREVLQALPPSEVSCQSIDLMADQLPAERTLGVIWDPESDTIGFKVREAMTPATKRGVLSKVSSVFDPFGIAAPFTVKAKILMQRLWCQKLDWNDELTGGDLENWQIWLKELIKLEMLKIPRCYRAPDVPSTGRQLHVFCDASDKAFGAVAYLRTQHADGNVRVAFVMSRCRVAPLKKLSIVRLEMQAAVLAVRLADTIRKEISYVIDETIFWSDSEIVLKYIANETKRFHIFIANRVAEIHDSSHPNQWRHIPGSLNPADIVSRGATVTELKSSVWLEGPEFLKLDDTNWPKSKLVDSMLQDDPEVKKVNTLSVAEVSTTLPDPARWSSWMKYKRVVATVVRAKSILMKRDVANTEPLKVSELEEAEMLIFKAAQEAAYGEEIADLRSHRPISRTSKILPLTPKLDENGVLRVGGRLKNAPIAEAAKHPILLPKNHEVTRLIIHHYHHQMFHGGLAVTMNEIRQKFWIPECRSTVKKLVRRCAYCIKRRAKPQPPIMADLPAARFDTASPFSSVGIDYFGPLQVRKFRKTEKRYGLLVTCLATRAVHLEVAYSLDTDSFIMALRRFIARRGKPKRIYSDNGTNFTGGEKELRDQLTKLNQTKIADATSQDHIQWYFNPPAASHMGGVWERLVQSVKRNLKVVLGKQIVTDEVLHTVFTEVEAVVNSRPLTYVNSSHDEPEAITPSHFLLGKTNPNLPPGVFDADDLNARKRWRQAQALTNQYWARSTREYLPTLVQRTKWKTASRDLQIDDVVLLADDNLPRGQWPLGRIIDVHPGSDGHVRSVELKTTSGVYRRPATKVCRLDA